MARKVRSIENRVLFTEKERREVDRFLSALEKSAECKVTFSDATRALWTLAIGNQKKICASAAQYEMQRPAYGDEAGLQALTHTLTVAIEEALRARK